MTHWRIACDACGVAAAIGPSGEHVDAWCEGCQLAARLPARVPPAPRCERCGQPLTLGQPRFEELYGRVQELAAVVAAWDGDPAPLARILPERPRYLTDLTPPDPRPGDPEPVRAALVALHEGRFRAARESLEPLLAPQAGMSRQPRLWHALAIAAERVGEPALAEAAWSRVIEHAPDDSAARLGRGALRARRGDFTAAREDFARAGQRHEARWDRAAARILEAVAITPGLPSPEVIAAARMDAPAASDYWIDPTVGRLLFSALVERARTRGGDGTDCPDARVLHAAEFELEFETYWDRAMVELGYARLGLTGDTAVAAATLAAADLATLRAEPAVAGPAGCVLAGALERVGAALAAGEPHAAREGLETLLAREDLRHYRVPCLACGRGAIGVGAFEEDDAP